MAHDNKALIRRWFEEVWNGRRRDVVPTLIVPGVRAWGFGAPGETTGVEGFLTLYDRYVAALPDIHFTIHEVLGAT